MSKWFKCSERLPPIGKYVLGRHNLGSWFDSRDQENVNVVVVIRSDAEVKDNNRLPFRWSTFGPTSFFGQNITEWAYIPAGEES